MEYVYIYTLVFQIPPEVNGVLGLFLGPAIPPKTTCLEAWGYIYIIKYMYTFPRPVELVCLNLIISYHHHLCLSNIISISPWTFFSIISTALCLLWAKKTIEKAPHC